MWPFFHCLTCVHLAQDGKDVRVFVRPMIVHLCTKLKDKGVLPLQGKHRLKRRNEFRRVFRSGQSCANRQFVLYTYRRKTDGPFRIGISVNRRVGNAVTRNRLKRIIKEVTRSWAEHIHLQTDLVVIARKPTAEMDYHQIKKSLRHLFNKSKVFRQTPPLND